MPCLFRIHPYYHGIQSLPSLIVLMCFSTVVLSRRASAFQQLMPVRSWQKYAVSIPKMSSNTHNDDIHPAVAGWPEKYTGSHSIGADHGGPRVLHHKFTIDKAVTQSQLDDLDVRNWPTWTTGDKPKWAEGNQNTGKVMPYGELSFVLSGKLEIIPKGGEVNIVEKGDIVTFPEGFESDWTVLEELTWHYFLY